MKTVILCGGYGTRLSEETIIKPKPMVKIGNKPILEHIMNIYKYYGYNQFILALGYKSEYIKKYYKNKKNISLVYTGKDTKTGGRLLRLKKLLKNEKTFMLTYGDGVSNINIKKAIKFHKDHGKIATITAVRPPVRFGELKIDGNKVNSFKEKPQVSQGWINGGFFIFNNEILNFIKNDQIMLEKEPLEKLTRENQLMAFKHEGFWKCMDTLRDKVLLNKLWKENKKLWRK
jgi:glucose-1-phosphate cytidylyltransferase|tara:strand:+ start:1086 stop:1778 length:693 start_codon:yes stop_codon:yes gene_type:complete